MSIAEEDFAQALGGHIWTLIYALGFMALVIALVGLLGLASAMGTSVLERQRELAVMRTTGATPGTLRLMILGEAALQALGGLALAWLVSLPLSWGLGNLIGMMSFRIPLQTTLDPLGLGIWITILLVGGLCASVLAAEKAAGISIREGIAYE